jgi:flagellar biosynthetic protein FliO
MKVFWRNLVLFAVLFIPVSGYSAASPSSAPAVEKAAGEELTPLASQPVPDAPAPEVRDTDMQFPVLRTIGGMGLVVFLMAGAFFGAKKFAPRYFNKPASQRNLKIVETLGMGDRRSISLIEVGGARFLVGNTPQQINLLATLSEPVSLVSEPETAETTTPKAPVKKGSGAPFRNLFEIEKGRPTQNAAHPLPDDLRVKMRQLRDALERS